MVRHLSVKELVMEDVDPQTAIAQLHDLRADAEHFLATHPRRPSYLSYWFHGYSRRGLKELSARLESTVAYISDSKSKLVINKLMDFPILRSLWFYHPTNYRWAAWGAIIVLPIGLTLYLLGLRQLSILRHEIETIVTVSDQLTELLSQPDPDTPDKIQ